MFNWRFEDSWWHRYSKFFVSLRFSCTTSKRESKRSIAKGRQLTSYPQWRLSRMRMLSPSFIIIVRISRMEKQFPWWPLSRRRLHGAAVYEIKVIKPARATSSAVEALTSLLPGKKLKTTAVNSPRIQSPYVNLRCKFLPVTLRVKRPSKLVDLTGSYMKL